MASNQLPRQIRPATSTSMARLFLGLDSSTQSLSAVVIDYDTRRVVYGQSLNFDKTLPHYGTQNGTLRDDNPLVVHSPPGSFRVAANEHLKRFEQRGHVKAKTNTTSGSKMPTHFTKVRSIHF
jgi:xylulokinase